MASIIKGGIKKISDTKKPTRYYSKKQETSVAKVVNGKTIANSGATPWQKGDVISDNILVECKTKVSDSKSISIKEDWLIKNKHEALFMGKEYSILAFNFGPDKPNYYILDEPTFQEFKEFLESK